VTVETIFLKDYQLPTYKTVETHLEFDIRPGKTLVRSRLCLQRTHPVHEQAGSLVLDGQDLQLTGISLDGVPLGGNEYRVDDDCLEIFQLPASCELLIETVIEPEANTSLEGLYKSGGMYCTQCEAEGFRKITYYQDRPDVLSRFTTTVEADAEAYPVLLSNGNLLSDGLVQGGRRRVTWQDPFPKPSYLFALVAGDLALLEDEFITASGRTVALRIYSEPHNIDQCDYAMGALKRAMRWDEETFGREYDLDVFMIVAVEDFNMGAMENKGLNIFNTSCVLATPDTATDAAYQRVEAVVAHEYFHNWSGNRVTCRDWFQLSLKEGFTVFRDAEFSSDMNSRAVKRIEDVNFLRSVQFAEDAGPMAHPIRPDSYMEISNFYTTTVYEKGSEVVRMLHTLLGPAAFRRGSDTYFARHDGAAATTDDFLAAMGESSKLDLGQFRLWYEQAGTPQLSVAEHWQEDVLTVRIRQSCPETPGQAHKPPLHMPVAIGLLDDQGRQLVNPQLEFDCSARCELRRESASLLLHVTEPETSLVVSGLEQRPQVSFLRGFSAPVRIDYPRDNSSLAFLAVHDSDGFARWDALQTLLVREMDNLQRGAEVSSEVTEVFAELLRLANLAGDVAEDKFMLAALLSLPEESYLFEQIPGFDVDAVCAAREFLRRHLAQTHLTLWQQLYAAERRIGVFSTDALSMARRSLANVALSYLAVALRGDPLQSLLLEHYGSADNLTDRQAALAQLVANEFVDEQLRQETLSAFYERWQHEALVVDLWFSLQASSSLCDVQRMLELEAHPAFDARNPNKLRAVYGAFAQRNHRNFHALSGAGYDFLADRVLRLNATNPQIAARLLAPLTRWQRYDAKRRELMCGVLERIAQTENLSKDVFEVVRKSLAPVA
jgi:aminopeptidase N